MSDEKHFRMERQEGVTVLQLLDLRLLDTLVVSEFQEELIRHLNEQKPKRVVVDFAAVSHCSTAVINGLLRAKKRLMEWGGDLRLCHMQPAVREAYQLLNLDGTVFHIYETQDDAFDSF